MRAMDALMQSLRAAPPVKIAGLAVIGVIDYLNDDTGLIPSDVLEFQLAGASKIIVRPSGTEPKLKLYLSVRGSTNADALRALKELDAGAKLLIGSNR